MRAWRDGRQQQAAARERGPKDQRVRKPVRPATSAAGTSSTTGGMAASASRNVYRAPRIRKRWWRLTRRATARCARTPARARLSLTGTGAWETLPRGRTEAPVLARATERWGGSEASRLRRGCSVGVWQFVRDGARWCRSEGVAPLQFLPQRDRALFLQPPAKSISNYNSFLVQQDPQSTKNTYNGISHLRRSCTTDSSPFPHARTQNAQSISPPLRLALKGSKHIYVSPKDTRTR